MKRLLRALADSEVFRFGLNGIIATAVHFSLATYLVWAGSGAAAANGAATLVAAVYSYLSHAYWSFRTVASASSLFRFAVVSCICAAVAAGVGGLVEAAGLGAIAGVVAAILVVPPLSYLLHRHWTYRREGSR